LNAYIFDFGLAYRFFRRSGTTISGRCGITVLLAFWLDWRVEVRKIARALKKNQMVFFS
jgi:hypothetical protein